MSTEQGDNRRYLLRLWIPALVGCAVVGTLLLLTLTSGDAARSIPAAIAVAFTVGMFFGTRWRQKRRIAQMLQTPDPDRFLSSFAKSMKRIPHGSLMAAANSATVLALYGRFEQAEGALSAESWDAAPPLIQAQESAARAVVAYARGTITEGLDYAVAASQQAALNLSAPGARTSDLAYRTYRNLGLALAGRATDTTTQELRTALAQLPLLGQVLAAWGLALIAKSTGASTELREMQAFLKKNAPYFVSSIEDSAG